jgi:hypothetical protein
VNSSIQRSLTKALARHGLGLYIYAGEDLPQDESTPEKTTKPKRLELNVGDENWSKVLRYVASNKDKGLTEIVKMLETKYNMKATVKKEIEKSL